MLPKMSFFAAFFALRFIAPLPLEEPARRGGAGVRA
jgi:hypothetical protein